MTDKTGQTSIEQLKFIVDENEIKLVSVQPQSYETNTENPSNKISSSREENSLKLKDEEELTPSERNYLIPFLPSLSYFKKII